MRSVAPMRAEQAKFVGSAAVAGVRAPPRSFEWIADEREDGNLEPEWIWHCVRVERSRFQSVARIAIAFVNICAHIQYHLHFAADNAEEGAGAGATGGREKHISKGNHNRRKKKKSESVVRSTRNVFA